MANPNKVVDISSRDEGTDEKGSFKSNRFKDSLRFVRDTVLGLALWTLFPLVVAGLTHLAGKLWHVSALTSALTWESAKDLSMWPILFAALVLCGGWGFLNVKYVRNPETKVRQLRREVATSIVMGYVWLMGLAAMISKETIFVIFVIPACIQAMDGIQSALEAINNAAQKMRLDDENKR